MVYVIQYGVNSYIKPVTAERNFVLSRKVALLCLFWSIAKHVPYGLF